MRAVILAAGLGARLGELTARRPKSLLEVGGASLLIRSFANLERAGVTETLVITGHAAEEIDAAAAAWSGRMPVATLQTPDYQRRGSAGSLLTAVERTGTAPMLLLESDLLYDAGFLTAALDCSGSTLLTAEVSGSGDEVYVCADAEDRLTYLGKAAAAEHRAASRGEFAGVSRLEAQTLELYAETARAWIEAGRIDAHYEEVLLALAQDGHPIRVRHCPGLAWTEVDNASDLKRAETQVLPRLGG